MRDRFHELIELHPVAGIWLLLWLLPLGGFTGAMLLLADAAPQLRAGLLFWLLLWVGYECRAVILQPKRVYRAPDGSWFGLWHSSEPGQKSLFSGAFGLFGISHGRRLAAGPATNSKNLTLERHFLLGTGSITMLVRDSKGRSYRLWCLKNACPDPQWRWLIVLLRWPDATKGQGNY